MPANIFGRKFKSTAISVDAKEFANVFASAGETSLIDLEIGKDKKAVLIRNVQVGPVDDGVLHIDFQQVDLKAKIIAQIPVELVGESPAEKQGLGTVVKYVDEIEIEALPTDLPDKFEIDTALLTEVDQSVLIKDIPVDKKNIEVKDDPEKIIVKVEPPRKEEEVVVATPAEGEAAAEAVADKEVSAEGAETPKQGETPKEESSKEPQGKPKENKKK